MPKEDSTQVVNNEDGWSFLDLITFGLLRPVKGKDIKPEKGEDN
jgi:hypothetical protein